VAPNFGELVEWREHKIKHRESVEFMMAMMVKNIPTICIDGKITFVSQIPARNELIQAIQNRINEKFKLKLHLHHNRLLLLGKQDEKFSELTKVAQQALLELGSTVEVELITEEEKVNQYNLAALPAVIAVKEGVKETGRVPSIDAVKEWLKDLA